MITVESSKGIRSGGVGVFESIGIWVEASKALFADRGFFRILAEIGFFAIECCRQCEREITN